MLEINDFEACKIDVSREDAYERGYSDAPTECSNPLKLRDQRARELYPHSPRLQTDYSDGWTNACLDAGYEA